LDEVFVLFFVSDFKIDVPPQAKKDLVTKKQQNTAPCFVTFLNF